MGQRNEKQKNWNLLLGVAAMGLVAWSIYGSAAPEASSGCREKVKLRMDEIQRRSGKAPGAEAEQRLLVSCSEAQLGVDMDELFTDKARAPDREARCRNSARFAISHGLESSGRNEEELVKLCLELPAEHAASCGFPSTPGEYFVIEGQLCVTRSGGIESRVAVKRDGKREKAHEAGDAPPDDSGSGGGSSAQ